MIRRTLCTLSALGIVACTPAPVAKPPSAEREASTPAAASQTSDAAAQAQIDAEADAIERAEAANKARAASDPVYALTQRAELCLHFAGEEGYDAERRAEINKAFEDNRCDTVVADGDRLKAAHPADAATIETAIRDLRN